MKRSTAIGWVGIGAVCLISAGAARHGAPRSSRAPRAPAQVIPDARAAATRSLSLIERGAAHYIKTRECFSCHHQALPLMTLSLARRKGLPVPEERINAQIDFTEIYYTPAIPEIRRGLGIQSSNTAAGYALLAFGAAGKTPDELTGAMGEFLAGRQLKDGHWYPSADRPPFEASEFTTTALAIADINRYGPAASAAEWPKRRQQAAVWLRREKPADTEDRVFQLRGLAAAGDATGVAAATKALRALQRPDGGWAQTPRMRSDAYATGGTLVALAEGGVPATNPTYRRGLKYLLGTQATDGSWRVTTRSRPQQTFFDNGDPYGRSQFISFAATNLAAMAILHSLPDPAVAPAAQASPELPAHGPVEAWAGTVFKRLP